MTLIHNQSNNHKPQEGSLGFTKNIQDLMNSNQNSANRDNRTKLLNLNQINNGNSSSSKSRNADHDDSYPTILNSPKLMQDSIQDITYVVQSDDNQISNTNPFINSAQNKFNNYNENIN